MRNRIASGLKRPAFLRVLAAVGAYAILIVDVATTIRDRGQPAPGSR